jgi:hypothetical protein
LDLNIFTLTSPFFLGWPAEIFFIFKTYFMKKLYLTIGFISASLFSFGQNLPVNFETGGNGANWTWTSFESGLTPPPLEIVANPDPSGINTSATVAKFTALQLAQPFAGCETHHGADVGTFNINVSNGIITMMVYKTKISDVGLKLVTSGGASRGAVKVPNTLINQWEKLTFDFSNYIGSINRIGSVQNPFDQLVVFPDWESRAADDVIYFDNISASCAPNASTLNVTDCHPYTAPSGAILTSTGTYMDTLFNANAGGCDSIITIHLTLLNVTCGQHFPVNFETGGNGANWTWTSFESGMTPPPLQIVANPDPSGINTSSTVAKFTALQTAQPFAGCETHHGADIGRFSIDGSNASITMMVYKTKISDVGLKLVTSSGASLGAVKVSNTVINQWEKLTFNFTNHINSVHNPFDQIVVFPDWESRATDDTIYFDNINSGCAQPLTGSVTSTICHEDSIVVNGTTYNAANPTGTETFTGIGINSCDSIVTINLTVLPALTGSVTNTICHEDSIVVNGTTYNAANPTGTEVFTGIGTNSCDSIVTINLTVLPALTGSVTNTICHEDSVVVNGTTYNAANPTGTEVFTGIGTNSCDSIVTINLTVLPALTGSVTNTICHEDSIVVNGTTYNAANPTGTEVFTGIGTNSCDSIVTINLTVLPALTGSVTDSICSGDSVVVNGTTYNETNLTGTEIFTGIGADNCDSTVTIALVLKASSLCLTGVSENMLSTDVTVYPNPFSNEMNISFLEKIDKTYTITIQNSIGQTVRVLKPTNQLVNIDLTSLEKGIYFVNITNAIGVKMIKMVKQ